ncbi:MAG: hypothetical protein J5808_07735 [Paludibacteraceae bacterium]|nr:hypothetical protein [Paludibacteraceae bacterium]
MANDISSLDQIKQQIQQLVGQNKSNQQKIKALEAENKGYLSLLEKCRTENAELQHKYETLQIAAAAVRLSDKDVAKAKARVTSIIKEIDNCIAQLSQ